MARDYFKAVNIETGEELLTLIPPAVPVIARQKLGDILGKDYTTGFLAAVYGALHREELTKLAKGVMTPEDYNISMLEWLMEWEPDVSTVYDESGKPQDRDADKEEVDGDPLL